MASSREFHDYVMEQLNRAGPFSSRKMMGEYCVYYRDKVIGLICDNQLLLKPTPSVLRLLPGACRAYPYEGSRTLMVLVEDLEDTERISALASALYGELPETGRRRPG